MNKTQSVTGSEVFAKAIGVVASLTVVLLTLAAWAAAGYKLRYQFPKGTTYRYLTTMEVEGSQEMMGQEMKYTSTAATVLRLDAEGPDNQNGLSYTLSYDSLRVKIHSPQGDTTLSNPPGVVHKRVRKIVSPWGKQIKSIEIDTLQINPLLRGFGSALRNICIDLPEKEVNLGESWTTTRTDTTQSMGGQVVATANLTHTLVGPEGKSGYECLKITYTGSISIKGSGTTQGMNFFMDGTGKVEGTYFFAPKEGLLVAQQAIADQEMTMAMTGQTNMTIPLSQSIQTTMTLMK